MSNDQHNGVANAKRLFLGSSFALIATSVAFAMVGATMGAMKEHFVLTNAEIGWVGGAALWGFAISIFIFGPLCDVLGMKLIFRLAFVGHFIGVLTMVFASGFTTLFIGALILAFGNGLVEAAANPLVTTIYPDRKTEMLNKFHVWFPGGIAIGGLIAYFMDNAGITSWQLKLLVILIPTVIYGLIFLGQKFPATERVQSGVSNKDMIKGTLLRPFFWLIFFAMMMTASVELGPNRWIPAVLESAGIPGILVLVWINLLMAVMRYYAGPFVHKLAPTGILFLSAIISGIGLYWLSYTDTLLSAIAAGTVFALGVCYFWPTMLGITSERVPKGGALALALVGGIGTIIVGLVTSPVMGKIADTYLPDKLPEEKTIVVMHEIIDTYPELMAQAKGKTGNDYKVAIEAAEKVLDEKEKTGILPPIATANAMRSAIAANPEASSAKHAKELLGPAENYAGKISFRYVVPLSLILTVVFGILYFRDKMKGGYKKEEITA